MAVGLNPDPPKLPLGNLISLLGGDLPAIVFSDDPIAKMHDSIPMVLFRFGILVKPSETYKLA
jgi:hypothetical protein